jgi:NTE family protein
MFIVTAGGLGVLGEDGRLRARLGAGEAVGEMGMITGRPRNATVVALRDSELLRLTRESFMRLVETHPEVALRLASVAVARLEPAPARLSPVAAARTFAVIPQGEDVDYGGFAVELTEALSALGRTELVWSARGAKHTSQWFHEVESRNDFVVYAADSGHTPWSRLSARQADALILLARAASAPVAWQDASATSHASRRSELVLLHEGGLQPGLAARWSAVLPGMPHHHVRHRADTERLARMLTGRAVGLVLSGGGARGFAHLGVVRAMRECRIPIDLVGGTSMGAVLAAGVALEWDDRELVTRFRRAFVDSRPLSDVTLPLVSLVAGRKVGRLLRGEFGAVDIADLPLPYFCVSANLTTGRVEIHERGPLWQWLRASIAIPGVLPPVFQHGEVFVDGGAMNNLPVDVMRERRRGPVIGVDVGSDPAFTTDLEATDLPPFWQLMRWARGGGQRPNIFQILWRSGMVNSAATSIGQRALSDLVLRPPLETIDLLNWRAFDSAVEIGYRDAMLQLAAAQGLSRI